MNPNGVKIAKGFQNVRRRLKHFLISQNISANLKGIKYSIIIKEVAKSNVHVMFCRYFPDVLQTCLIRKAGN